MLSELKEASQAVGLKMNLQKTKIMNPNKNIQIILDNHTIQVTEEYQYLGHNIKIDKETVPDSRDREENRASMGGVWKPQAHSQGIENPNQPQKKSI